MNSRSRWHTVAVGSATAVLASLLTIAGQTAATAGVQVTYYASPTGAGNLCSSTTPCSLEDARDKVRTVNTNMTGDIVVELRGGTYSLDSTFQLTAVDSGSNGYNIIYRAKTGETPVLSGGTVVTDDFTEIDTTKHIWEADVPAAVETRQLYVDEVRATRARSSGYPSMAVNSNGYTLPAGAPYNSMQNWKNVSDIEVVAKYSWKRARYSVQSISSSAIDLDDEGWNDGATQPSYAARQMMWIENAYELLDTPGEWYHDRALDKLYYIPLDGQDVNNADFVLGTTVKLLEAGGTLANPLHDVQLDGLTFSYDGWVEPNTTKGYPDFQGGAVYRGAVAPGTPEPWSENNYQTPAGVTVSAAKNVVIKNSTFKHMANAALSVGPGTQDSAINGNTFTDISGNGINVGGITKADHHPANPASIVKNVVVSNNAISKVGAEYQDNVGIFLGYTQGAQVKHNTLSDLPYTAISFGWGWGYVDTLGATVAKDNVIQGNLLHDYMQTVHDGGGIYSLGSQQGSRVLDNHSYADRGNYGHLYRDNGSAGIVDRGNVIDHAPGDEDTWYFVNIGSGSYFMPTNNIAERNYYAAGMNLSTGNTNTIGFNKTVFNGEWPARAQAVMANAGVGGDDLTLLDSGEVPVSLGKSATASSVHNTTTYNADKAVDGDAATRWAQQSGLADPSSLTVDLGEPHVVTGVHTSTYRYLGKGVKYAVEYSDNGTTFSPYADRTTSFVIPGDDIKPTPVTARYWRVRFTDTQKQGGSIWEFSVFGHPVPASQGKSTSASSQYDSTNYSSAKAVDGNEATRWAASNVGPATFTVDLGSLHDISHVETQAVLDLGRGLKYAIETSTNNTAWTTYADRTGNYSNPGVDTKAEEVLARYVRIRLTDTQGQRASLHEFRVFGTPLDLLSQGKAATASSEYSSGFDAAKAVDGDAGTRWAQASGMPDPSSLTVDLGASQPIAAVNTSAYAPPGGVKYKIEYSTDGTNFLLYADRTATPSTPGLDTNPNPITARYVRITLTATQGFGGSLWEFEVYAD